MRSAYFPKEVSRIKLKARWIELLHLRKFGLRLLYRSILLNFRMGTQKLKWLMIKK
jgi:hypothetical protein